MDGSHKHNTEQKKQKHNRVHIMIHLQKAPKQAKLLFRDRYTGDKIAKKNKEMLKLEWWLPLGERKWHTVSGMMAVLYLLTWVVATQVLIYNYFLRCTCFILFYDCSGIAGKISKKIVGRIVVRGFLFYVLTVIFYFLEAIISISSKIIKSPVLSLWRKQWI